MLARSEAFDTAIRGDYTSIVQADLYRSGQYRRTIEVLGGSWSDDSTAEVRRRGTLALDPVDDLIPSAAWVDDGGLWPVGNEIQLRVGLLLPSGQPELLDVARLRISKPKAVDNGTTLTLSVDGFDRARSVKRARFTQPYVVSSGRDYATAIHDLILSRIPSLRDDEFVFMSTDGSDGNGVFKTPLLTFLPSDDPWKMAQNMAQSFGAELFFDGTGRCVLRQMRDPSYEATDWDYKESVFGEPTNLLGVERTLDDEHSYNGVIVDSSNSELKRPIHAEFWDTNPQSATYFDPGRPTESEYGPVPFFMDSQYITTQEQADTAAVNNFLRVSGLVEDVNFASVGHPAHESGDLLGIKRDRIKVDGAYVLESFQAGLGYTGTMTGATRSRRVM